MKCMAGSMVVFPKDVLCAVHKGHIATDIRMQTSLIALMVCVLSGIGTEYH